MEKACKLSMSYKCDVGIIIFIKDNKLSQYADKDMDNLLHKYIQHSDPHVSMTNTDIIRVNIKI